MRIVILVSLLAACKFSSEPLRVCPDQTAVIAALDACVKAGTAAAKDYPSTTHSNCLDWARKVACTPLASMPDGGVP